MIDGFLSENLPNRFSHVGVEVHGVHEIHIGVLLAEVFHGGDHADEAVAKVLTTVAGDENELAAAVEPGDVVAGRLEHPRLLVGQGGIAPEPVYHHVEGVDDGVAGDEDLTLSLFFQEVLFAERGGSEVVCGDAAGNLAVHLFRPGAVDVAGAQAGLNVADGDLLVEGGKGRGGAGGSVSMDKDHVGLYFLQDIAHAGEHAGGDVVEVLALFHYVEVVVRGDLEDAQHLVQHLAVLAGDAHYSLELFRVFLELLYQGAHLDCLRPGSKN